MTSGKSDGAAKIQKSLSISKKRDCLQQQTKKIEEEEKAGIQLTLLKMFCWTKINEHHEHHRRTEKEHTWGDPAFVKVVGCPERAPSS